MIREILLAVDFSQSSEDAARVAVEHARQFDARLHVLHVVWPGSDPTPDPRLARIADPVRDRITVVTAVESGIAAVEIVRYAAAHAIDLIVLGTHGRTGMTRALIGSVAERVVRTAPCPVLTVPAGGRAAVTVAAGAAEPTVARCLVCAQPSEDLVCETCRARVRGEALDAKTRAERAGRA